MKAPFEQYRKVERMKPQTPVGAVVTAGTRDEKSGNPVKTDRFFIKSPRLEQRKFTARSGKQFSGDFRVHHPDFEAWNSRAERTQKVIDSDGNVRRDLSQMHGVILFGAPEQSFASKYWADSLPNEENPGGRYPACTGNGETASRFVKTVNDAPIYKQIECPEDCPFLSGDQPACKLRSSLLFMPDWGPGSPLPRVIAQWVTHSPQSGENALGLLQSVRDMGAAQGNPNPSLAGLPFTMAIETGTSSLKKRRFPIVKFSLRINPVSFYLDQKAAQQQLGDGGFVTATSTDYYIDSPEEQQLLEAGASADLAGPVDDPLPDVGDLDDLPAAPVSAEVTK